MYKEGFATRLKKAREDAGYTQSHVEEYTGIKRILLSHYETGWREPDIETIGILATFYNTSIDWLLSVNKKELEKN